MSSVSVFPTTLVLQTRMKARISAKALDCSNLFRDAGETMRLRGSWNVCCSIDTSSISLAVACDSAVLEDAAAVNGSGVAELGPVCDAMPADSRNLEMMASLAASGTGARRVVDDMLCMIVAERARYYAIGLAAVVIKVVAVKVLVAAHHKKESCEGSGRSESLHTSEAERVLLSLFAGTRDLRNYRFVMLILATKSRRIFIQRSRLNQIAHTRFKVARFTEVAGQEQQKASRRLGMNERD